jgi:hypothetical protein
MSGMLDDKPKHVTLSPSKPKVEIHYVNNPSQKALKPRVVKWTPPHSGTLWTDLISRNFPEFKPIITEETISHAANFLICSYGKINLERFDAKTFLIPSYLITFYLKSFSSEFIPIKLRRYTEYPYNNGRILSELSQGFNKISNEVRLEIKRMVKDYMMKILGSQFESCIITYVKDNGFREYKTFGIREEDINQFKTWARKHLAEYIMFES